MLGFLLLLVKGSYPVHFPAFYMHPAQLKDRCKKAYRIIDPVTDFRKYEISQEMYRSFLLAYTAFL